MAASGNHQPNPGAAVPSQNLSSDPLLENLPRQESHGASRPVIGGVALIAKIKGDGQRGLYYGVSKAGQAAAVRVLNLSGWDPMSVQLQIHQAKLAAQVHSPHLLVTTALGHEAGLYYMISDYVPGPTAQQYLDELKAVSAAMAQDESLKTVIAATAGLKAAHAHGMLHRDVKPDNILIPGKGGAAKELDFAGARLMNLSLGLGDAGDSFQSDAQLALGTLGYKAPEQALDPQTAGKPADVFSMGATLYALLAGRPPFHDKSQILVLMATVEKPHDSILSLRADVSPALATLIDRCLAKKPAQRYADAGALLDALKAI